MPQALSTHPEPYQHHWPAGDLYLGWTYPPKDYEKWSHLIYEWVKHCLERYGKQEVSSGIGKSGMNRISDIGMARPRNMTASMTLRRRP